MAFWTNLINALFLPGRPILGSTGIALRDNMLAITEGAPNAPKIQGKALDIAIGNLNGTTAIVDLDDAAKVFIVAQSFSAGNGSAGASISCMLSADNGATWPTGVGIASVTNSGGSETNVQAQASGARIIDMTGYNAIRLTGTGGISGSLFYVEGT